MLKLRLRTIVILIALVAIVLSFVPLLLEMARAESGSLVDTVNTQHAVEFNFQRATFYGNGRYWAFYSDGTNMVWKTSLDGDSWGDKATVRACEEADHFSIWFDETYVHYTYHSWVYDTPAYYRRGLCESDGTITWSAAEQVALVADPDLTYRELSIATDSDGYPWISTERWVEGFQESPVATKSSTNDGTWTTEGGFPYQLGVDVGGDAFITIVVPLTSSKMLVVWNAQGGSSFLISVRQWNGSSWGTQANSTSEVSSWWGISAVAEDDNVHIVFRNSTVSGLTYVKYFGATNTFGSEVTVVTTSSNGPSLTIDEATGILYCIWMNAADNHIYYKKYIDGSWDANSTDWLDEDIDNIWQAYYLHSFYRAGNDEIGILYSTRTSSPYKLKFALFTVDPAPTPTPTPTPSPTPTPTPTPTPEVVATTTDSGAVDVTGQRKTFYANGRHWAFYHDGNLNMSYKTSTDGSSWSAETDIRAMCTGACYGDDFSVFFDGNYIHYAVLYNGHTIYYRRGVPESDGTITWSAAEQTVISSAEESWDIDGFINIAVDTEGYPWIGCTKENEEEVTYPLVIKSQYNNGTWLTVAPFPLVAFGDDAEGSGYWTISLAPVSGQDMVVIASHTDRKIKGLLIYEDGGWVPSAVDETDSFIDGGSEISVTSFGEYAYVAFSKYSVEDITYCYYNASTKLFSSEEEVATVAHSISPTISVDDDDVKRVFWIGSDDHIYYKEKEGEGSWSSATDWIDESIDGFLWYKSLTSSYRAYDGVTGLLYLTKTGSPYNVKYGYLTSFAAATLSATSVEETSATLQGSIPYLGGGANATERGFDWGLTESYGGNWTESGSFGVGSFSHGISSLSPGTLYHFRAKAYASGGWSYGSDRYFTTKPEAPTGLTVSSSTFNSLVVDWTKGTGAVYTMVRRKTGSYPTSPTDGIQAYYGLGNTFTNYSLGSGITYYYRAWSYTSPTYSDSYSQTTGTTCCFVTTNAATDVSQTGATLVGSIATAGDSNVDWIAFDWGLTVAYGSSWSTDSGAPYGADEYTHTIGDLSSGATYHYRFRARDDCGWNNGNDRTFTALGAPIVTTDYAEVITGDAKVYGTLVDFGDGSSSASVWFRYGIEEGNYPYTTTPEAVTSLGQFSATLTGLHSGVRYHFTAVAQNAISTGYGSDKTFVITAAAVDSCNYCTEIQVSSDSSYAYLGLVVSLNHSYMINNGYTLTDSGLDTKMVLAESLAVPHTPSSGNLTFMLNALGGNVTATTKYYLGAVPLLSDLDFVVGYGGSVTTSYDAGLEPGDTFTVDISGVVNTSLTNKDIVRKTNAFYIRVNDGNVTVIVGNTTSPLASVTTEVASGTHRITTTSDGTTLKLHVDGVLRGNDTATSVPENENDWYFLLDNSMPSMEYLGIEIDEDWTLWYQPMELIADDTLVDVAGSYDASITWGSNPSDVEVTIGNLVPCEVVAVVPQEEEILPEIVQPSFDVGSDYSHLPLSDFFHEFLPMGDIPEKVFWSGSVFVVAIALGLTSFIFIKSVEVMLGIMGAILIAGIMTDPPILSYWVPLVYGLLAVTYLIRRHASPI